MHACIVLALAGEQHDAVRSEVARLGPVIYQILNAVLGGEGNKKGKRGVTMEGRPRNVATLQARN
jgi:hypothetical protein